MYEGEFSVIALYDTKTDSMYHDDAILISHLTTTKNITYLTLQ